MRLNPKTLLIIVLLTWLCVQAMLLLLNGIVIDGEAAKYISQAKLFQSTGQLESFNFWLYATQIFLILISFKLKLGFILVVAIQLLFNLWATLALYRFTSKLFTTRVAIACTLIFLINYPLQEFNTFLQTESLYYSLTILFSLWLLQLNRLTVLNFLAVTGFLLLIAVTRPTGILFIPCAFLYLFFRFFRVIPTRYKILIVSTVTVLFLFLANMAIGSGGELDFMLPYRDERIICGVPTLHHFVDIKTAENGNSLYGLFYYITHNIEQFSRMALLRSVAFFGLLRSYYSTGHNLALALFFYPVYILVVFSIRYWVKNKPHLLLYCSSCILATWGTVLLTCDDWHNRFYLAIWPYLILLALPAINNLFAKFAPNDRNTPV